MHQAAAAEAAEAEAEAEAAAARGGQTLLCRPSPPVCVWMQEGDGGREGKPGKESPPPPTLAPLLWCGGGGGGGGET